MQKLMVCLFLYFGADRLPFFHVWVHRYTNPHNREAPEKADILSSGLGAMYQKLDPKLTVDLSGALRKCVKVKQKWQLGTICSGTDIVVLVLDYLSQLWLKKFGVALIIEHVFSCEIDPVKRQFIESCFKSRFMFCDALTLTEGPQLDCHSGLHVVAPQVDVLVAGFECDNFSSCSTEKATSHGCIAGAFGKSGRTCKGVMMYIEAKKPLLVILENVQGIDAGKAIGSTDLDSVLDCLSWLGYEICHDILDAKDYFIPQSRRRVYIVAVLASVEPIPLYIQKDGQLERNEMYKNPKWPEELKAFAAGFRVECAPVDFFLLLDDNEHVLACREEKNKVKIAALAKAMESLAKKTEKKESSDPLKYESDHLMAYAEAQLDEELEYPPDWAKIKARFVCVCECLYVLQWGKNLGSLRGARRLCRCGET